MGNHSSRHGASKKEHKEPATNNTETQAAKSISRSSSGNDIEHNSHMRFFPIDNLAKILQEISHREEGVHHGITVKVFEKYLFPRYPDLAERLFIYLHHTAQATTKHITTSNFRQQAEKFLAIMNDQTVLDNYVKMYSNIKEEGDVNQQNFKELLMVSYKLAMDNSNSASCPHIARTINAVVVSCFHQKDSLSANFVGHWLWQHCPKLMRGVHRYVVHVLTTAYRSGKSLLSKEDTPPHLDPGTPVLEKSGPFMPNDMPLLPVSYAWLLSSTLADCYSQAVHSPTEGAEGFIAKMIGSTCPSHWTLLYNSDQHGTGTNRFLHHVLGYKGPTILLIRAAGMAENETGTIYCLCSAVEWKETHLYWGDEDSCVIEMFPSYKVVETGPKILYLNTGIRGYPQGVRAGKDPRKPCVIIDQDFKSVSFAGVPHKLDSIEVWGCGDRKSREKQLEIKKWQVKEAEKQRVVKMSATDWLDHPDRYLLELAGRQSYNNTNNN